MSVELEKARADRQAALNALGEIAALGQICDECEAYEVTHEQTLPGGVTWYLCAECAAAEERLNENAIENGGVADPIVSFEEEIHVRIARDALRAITGHL